MAVVALNRSKPSLASVVACMMPFMMGVCFLCPSMDCLWHKYHYCPSCGEKVRHRLVQTLFSHWAFSFSFFFQLSFECTRSAGGWVQEVGSVPRCGSNSLVWTELRCACVRTYPAWYPNRFHGWELCIVLEWSALYIEKATTLLYTIYMYLNRCIFAKVMNCLFMFVTRSSDGVQFRHTYPILAMGWHHLIISKSIVIPYYQFVLPKEKSQVLWGEV